jgi:hypothetical protein
MPAYPAWPHPTALGFHSEWRVAERRTGRERMDSPTLQTLKDPILAGLALLLRVLMERMDGYVGAECCGVIKHGIAGSANPFSVRIHPRSHCI